MIANIVMNYVQTITKKIAISTEAKWMNAFQTKDNQLALQVNLAWNFFEYLYIKLTGSPHCKPISYKY